MKLTDQDEYLHPPPEGGSGLWSDNFWFSVADREADVFGINHIHASLSHSYLRASAFYVIDGVHQQWASRSPLEGGGEFDELGDGRVKFSVLKPYESYRWVFDGEKFGFDLRFDARFAPFDYADCFGGNPLATYESYGGHYEQALNCSGSLETYGGPRAGERRRISCWSHRDHSWTYRFTQPSSWEPKRRKTQQASWGHFWPSVQLPERHLNSFGWMSPTQPIPEGRAHTGGWIADASGSRPIRSAGCTPRMEDDERTAMSFRMTFELTDGETLTVLTGRKHAQTRNGLMRDENDAEARLDCYEPFFDFEVLETGERGYGVVEYSVHPPWPRFRF